MGALLGVTGQSIYKWESGQSKPRAAQLEAITALRGIGGRPGSAGRTGRHNRSKLTPYATMTLFHKTVDSLCSEKTQHLGRDLFWDEVRLIEDTLFMEWRQAKRYDDLIDHALDEYDLQDGAVFCGSLGEALAQAGDRARFEKLFGGLAKTREAAFWRTWPQAQEGHIGAMKESAKHVANALEAMAGLWHCYWVIKDNAGMESTKARMLRLQAREKPQRQNRRNTED